MAEVLIEVTRGSVIECLHRGDIAVTNNSGDLLAAIGDPEKISYLRSAAKPLQALNVITSGAYDHFHFSAREVAIMCSSHYAEPFHRETVESILKKTGLNRDYILGGTVTSLNSQYALQLARENVELTPLFSDCSGKHAGMLAVCVHRGYNLTSYLEADHPCQLGILQALSEMCAVPKKSISLGIDGCSAPVHAMPLKKMATGFARLANWSETPERYIAGARIIFEAMNKHPEMVSGTGGFCTELIRHTNGKLIGKIGAEGVYCIGLHKHNIGIAIKIESGNMAMLPPIVISVLEQLDVLNPQELELLNSYRVVQNVNDLEKVVGAITPVFTLKKT
jgi:L-asparaginase II